MSYLSSEDFLSGILGKAVDFDVPGVGLVQLRPLTFAEVREINQAHGNDVAALTLATVAAGLAQPQLSPEQAQQLERARPGVIAALSERIMQISGMVDGLPPAKAEDLGNAAGGGS